MDQIKIGTEEEAFWREIKESTKKDIEAHQKLLKFSQAILELAEKKIKESK